MHNSKNSAPGPNCKNLIEKLDHYLDERVREMEEAIEKLKYFLTENEVEALKCKFATKIDRVTTAFGKKYQQLLKSKAISEEEADKLIEEAISRLP